MLRRAANALRGTSDSSMSSGGPAAESDADREEALLQSWEQQGVAPATLQAFEGSSELPAGAPQRRLLQRYLRAEKLDLAKAAARLERQAAWRHGFGSVSEDDVAVELASGKVKLQPPSGRSGGRPLLVVKACRHRPGATPQQVNQFIFFCLEATSHYCWDARNADGKLAVLVDLAGLQLKNLDAGALRASFHMLADHFPERLAAVYMLDAPTIFFGIWKLVEPFIDRTARKNIHFVSGKAAHAMLLEALGPDTLPLEYGGQAAEVPVELAAQQLPAWQQQQQQQQQQAGVAPAAAAEQQPVVAQPPPSPARQQRLEALTRHTGSLRLSESTSDLTAVA